MTADLSDDETSSRPDRHFPPKVRSGFEQNVSFRDGRLKDGNRVIKEGKDRGREGVRVGVKNCGAVENGTGGHKDLGKSSSLKSRKAGRDITEQIRRELDSQFPSKNPGSAESEGEGKGEESEDDFEEGDGAIAEVACQQPEQQLKQQQGASVDWESFLPHRHLRVLLVEDDDSTRHVVGALLRNCGYEVTSAANGMVAWDMIEDANINFDLVLTDVVMPCLSGVGLLSKMMSRKVCNRVPVVMMSSHDSMDIVFRCLSKGAADFLVKPVRKNELKNLWQHVWRRCHTSSGSGSGSGSQTGKVMRPKSRVGSDDNSDEGSENGSSGLNVRGGSDNGSGNQARLLPAQMQRNNSSPEAADVYDEGQTTFQEKASSDQEMGQDLEMATLRHAPPNLQQQDAEGKASEVMQEEPATCGGKRDEPSSSGANGSSEDRSQKAIDLIGGIACQPPTEDGEQPGESEDGDEVLDRGGSNSPRNKGNLRSDSSSFPTLELSLKRPRAVGDNDGDADDRRVLRHSGSSAFSRYSTSGQHQHPAGGGLSLNGYVMTGGYGAHLSSGGVTVVDRAGSSKGSGEASMPLPLYPQTFPGGNGQDTSSSVAGASTQDARPIKDETVLVPGMPMTIPISPPGLVAYEGVSAGYAPAIHPMYYTHPGGPAWVTGPSSHVADGGEVFDHPSAYHECNACPGHFSHPHGHRHSHHHSHHHQNTQRHHHHHHHSHGPQPSSLLSQQEEQQTGKSGPGGPRCGSSNMVPTVLDGNNGQSGSSNGYGSKGNGNGSVNGCASGSNNGSNGHNGHNHGHSCVTVGVTATTNGDSGNKGNSGSGVGNCMNTADGAMGPEQTRFAQREAALNKFRQKRKERCFEKKVRYQSRKRLAEQRPRVRGQFVRQTVYDFSAGEAD